MKPRRDSLVLYGIGLVAAVLVVLGIATVGGPDIARAERRDQARLSDLQELVSYIGCLTASAGDVLPQTLDPADKTCAVDPPLSDRFDGAPVRYEPLSAKSYRLCATFELPERLMPYMGINSAESFEPSTGCLTVILPG
jgi:ethanolamine utilization microcompartment shell protein EutS